MSEIQIEFIPAISLIPAQEWNHLMSTGLDERTSINPFVRHEYLAALESSGCVCTKTGWTPMHLTVLQGEKRLAVMPLYEKTHSYGEYVFDWAWAEAYERNSIDYYPKLLCAIPFTPVTGPRVGIAKDLTQSEAALVWSKIAERLSEMQQKSGYSSWHALFLTKPECDMFSKQNALNRVGTQFHWMNKGYHSFDDYLAAMHSRKRKDIRKERYRVAQYGLTMRFVDGGEVTDEQWQAFSHCYQMTYAKRSGHYGYLNLSFFKSLAQSMPHQIKLLLVEVNEEDSGAGFEDKQGQRIIASALYFCSDTHLYGRYWGALESIEGLHFEVCYYQGIEYCIEHGLQTFDAGAQGEHKVPRGFEPVTIYSNHDIAHPAFRDAIEHFTHQERAQISCYMKEMGQSLPFKSSD
ncbi:GNAT family N-acetyltransferase [Shewanella nanhaiensis]|uniref:GNAT family N-acetyltransferase n=1 Tax=Shewanella nanhaiensis TaxID=2864872 RepID=A0ABS7E2N0_9GAMM|nr:GNAT family N-acetyltransferase [Shewanella nanhaiensis]MBW8183805.1 GNAT family N-acetyltransferase [Shewanella nanhaiensis]